MCPGPPDTFESIHAVAILNYMASNTYDSPCQVTLAFQPVFHLLVFGSQMGEFQCQISCPMKQLVNHFSIKI